MDYFSLENGLQFQILLPCSFLFFKILDFQYSYYKNRYKKKIIIAGIFISAVSLPILFLLNFEPYFIFIWCLLFFVVPSAMSFFVRLSGETEEYHEIDSFSYKIFGLSCFSGLFIMILPYLSIFERLGGEPNDYRIAWISRTIYFALGLSLILLNKVMEHHIWHK
ncbi:hypothetical protein Sgly_1462 [Syntrophobotulus glycolicus DSM 8271]|uniref:Uncharacterized protein n=1 Tax=Syntrophobotulus glycolicus (strain DSM 8271 / FlGlyR) TaxID=645991 RepID=F0SWY0_SYNGF|nr:hypothetical protein Sgly_1462 [Syntrophobotulus glycolicus DSM 8271]